MLLLEIFNNREVGDMKTSRIRMKEEKRIPVFRRVAPLLAAVGMAISCGPSEDNGPHNTGGEAGAVNTGGASGTGGQTSGGTGNSSGTGGSATRCPGVYNTQIIDMSFTIGEAQEVGGYDVEYLSPSSTGGFNMKISCTAEPSIVIEESVYVPTLELQRAIDIPQDNKRMGILVTEQTGNDIIASCAVVDL